MMMMSATLRGFARRFLAGLLPRLLAGLLPFAAASVALFAPAASETQTGIRSSATVFTASPEPGYYVKEWNVDCKGGADKTTGGGDASGGQPKTCELLNPPSDPASPANVVATFAPVRNCENENRNKGDGTVSNCGPCNLGHSDNGNSENKCSVHDTVAIGNNNALATLVRFRNEQPGAFAAALKERDDSPNGGNTPLQTALTVAVAASLSDKPAVPAIVSLFLSEGADVALFSGTTAGSGCANRWNFYQYVGTAGLPGNDGAFASNTAHSPMRLSVLSELGKDSRVDSARGDCDRNDAALVHRAALWGLAELMTVLVQAENKNLDKVSAGNFALYDAVVGRDRDNFVDENGIAVVRLLLNNGADVALTKDGRTPLDLIAEREPFDDNATPAALMRNAGMVCLRQSSPAYCPAAAVTVVFSQSDNGVVSAASGGTVVNSGDEVAPGTTVTFTAAPSDDYVVRRWTGDCANVGATYDFVGDDSEKTCAAFRNIAAQVSIGAVFIPDAVNASLVAEVKKAEPDLDELLRLLALDADPNAREDEPGATDDPEALILAASVPNSLAKARAVSVLITAGADPRATSGTEFNNRSLPIHAGRNSDAAEQAAQMVRLLRHFIAALGETANDSPPGPNYDWNYDGGSFGQALKWVRNYCAVNDAPDACGELAALMYERGSRCAGGREGAEDGALCEVPVENIARALPRDFNAPVATVAARDFGRTRFDLALPDAEKLLELQSGGWTLALNESRPQRIVLSRTVPVAGGEVALFTIAAMLAGESEVVREYRASVAGPSPDDLLVAEAAQTVSAPDLAEVRRLLNDENADPDATNENGVPVMLIAAANLHAEMVSVLVTAGADVSVSHSLLDGLPLPHLMAANECSGTEPEQIPARGWPESLEVLQHFHNAASLSGQPYDHRREVGGFAAVELLDDSYANCTPDDNVDGDAILRMRNILLYDPDGGGVYCDGDDIICYATRFVDFPAPSELTGGALSVFIVAVDESETAIDPGEEVDNRFSIRFVAVPETGRRPVWSEDCEAVVPGAARCDLPRSADDLTVSVAFADSAALASALLLREVLKEPPLAPEPASVVALLDRGADPNLMIEDNHILPVVVFRRSGDAADSFARAEIVSILITAGANPRGALAVGSDIPFIVAFQSEELSGLQSGLSILRRFIGGMGRRLQSHPDDAPDYDWTRAVGNATVPQVLRDYCDAENDPATCREMADLLYERGGRCVPEDDDHFLCARPRDFAQALATPGESGPVATVAARDFGREQFDLRLPGAEVLASLSATGWTLALDETRPQKIVLSSDGPASGSALFTVTSFLRNTIVAREHAFEAGLESSNRRVFRFTQPAFGGTLKAAGGGVPINNGDDRPVNQFVVFAAEPAPGYRVHEWGGDCAERGETGGPEGGGARTCEIPPSDSDDEITAAVVFHQICAPPLSGFGFNDCRLHPDVPPVGDPLPATPEARTAFCEAFGGTYFSADGRCQVWDEPFPNNNVNDPDATLQSCVGDSQCDEYFEAWRACGAERKALDDDLQCDFACAAIGGTYGVQSSRMMGFQFHCRASDRDRFAGVPAQTRGVRMGDSAFGGKLSAVTDRGVALTAGINDVFKSAGVEFTATPAPDDFVLTWLGHCAASPAGDPDNPGVEKTCAIEPGLGDIAVAVVFGNIQTSLLVAEVMKDSPNLASVAALLNDGANPNQPSDNLAVPVMHAVARNASIAVSLRADIVSVLITAGADPNSRDASGPAPRTVPHLMAANPPDGTGVPYAEALEVLRHFDDALALSGNPGRRDYVWWRDVPNTGTDSPSPLDILVSRRAAPALSDQQSAVAEMAAFIRSKGGLCQTTPNSDFAPPICLPPPAADNFHAYAAAGDEAAFNALNDVLQNNPSAFAASITTTYGGRNTPLQAALAAAVASGGESKTYLPAIVSLFVANGAEVSLFSGTTAGTGCAERWNLYQYVGTAGLLSGPGLFNANTTHSAVRLSVLAVLGETGLDATRNDCAQNVALIHRAAFWGLPDLMAVLLRAQNKNPDAKSGVGNFALYDAVNARNFGHHTDAEALAMLSALLDAGADPNLFKTSSSGSRQETALDRLAELRPFDDNRFAADFLLNRGMECRLRHASPFNDPLCAPSAMAPNFHAAASAGTDAALVSLALYFAERPSVFRASLAITNADGNTPLQSALTAAVAGGTGRESIPAMVRLFIAGGADANIYSGTTTGPADDDCSANEQPRRWNLFQYVARSGLLSGGDELQTEPSPLRLSVLAELSRAPEIDATRFDCGADGVQLVGLHMEAAAFGLGALMTVIAEAANRDFNDNIGDGEVLRAVVLGRKNGHWEAGEVADILRLLLDNGADPKTAAEEDEPTALDALAQNAGHANFADGVGQRVADLLIAAGANCETETHATFCPSQVRVVFSQSANGTLSAASDGGEVTVGMELPPGATITFTADPDPGHFVARWTGACEGDGAVRDDHSDAQNKTCALEDVPAGRVSVGVVFAPANVNELLFAEVKRPDPDPDEVSRLLGLDADPDYRSSDDDNRTSAMEVVFGYHRSPDFSDFSRARIVSILVAAGATPNPGGRDMMIQVGRNSDNANALPMQLEIVRNFIAALGETSGDDYDWGANTAELNRVQQPALGWLRAYCNQTAAPAVCREIAALMYERGSRCAGDDNDILCRLPVESLERELPPGFNDAVTVIIARDFGRSRFSLSFPAASELSSLSADGWSVVPLTTSRPWQAVIARNRPIVAGTDAPAVFTITAFNGPTIIREHRISLSAPPSPQLQSAPPPNPGFTDPGSLITRPAAPVDVKQLLSSRNFYSGESRNKNIRNLRRQAVLKQSRASARIPLAREVADIFISLGRNENSAMTVVINDDSS